MTASFDSLLKTFLAAVENPRSVLYTKNMRGQRSNSAAYYGAVCSTLTSYALQSAIMLPSRGHLPAYREGIRAVDPQSAQGAETGDLVFMPGHVELVTGVTRDSGGVVVLVRWEDSGPPTTRTREGTPADFEAYLERRKATLYRVTDPGAWHGDGEAGTFRFPDYESDSAIPPINRALLLDRGDWVAYRLGETVEFNVMDRDGQGMESLVIRCGGELVERIEMDGPGVIERIFEKSGDYTAHCVFRDGTESEACEFSVCAIEARPASGEVLLGESWTIALHAQNMEPVLVRQSSRGDVSGGEDYRPPRDFWLSDEDRRRGEIVIPADSLEEAGRVTFTIWGENRYGRLRAKASVKVAEQEKESTATSPPGRTM